MITILIVLATRGMHANDDSQSPICCQLAAGHTLDITSMKPFSLQARVWADIWPDPIPTHQRKPMFGALTREGPGAGRNGLPLASWATHYCDGSKSRREAYVRELMQHIAIDIYGSVENCLANVPEELASADDKTQWTAQRHGPKFYLAFENDRCDDYVTEKLYWALLRGQVRLAALSPATPSTCCHDDRSPDRPPLLLIPTASGQRLRPLLSSPAGPHSAGHAHYAPVGTASLLLHRRQ